MESTKRGSGKSSRSPAGQGSRGSRGGGGARRTGPQRPGARGSTGGAQGNIPAHHTASPSEEAAEFDAGAARALLVARFASSAAWQSGGDDKLAAPGTAPAHVYQTQSVTTPAWGAKQSAAERVQSGKPFLARVQEAKAAASVDAAAANADPSARPPGLQ